MSKKRTAIRTSLLVTALITGIAASWLGTRLYVNAQLVSELGHGDKIESVHKVQTMKSLNLIDNYILEYNLGNAAYQDEKYTDAISHYKAALGYSVPKGKECPIRINYAMSQTKLIDFDRIDSTLEDYRQHKGGENAQILRDKLTKDIDAAIEDLNEALETLRADGCAGKGDAAGHSEEADSLAQDIEDKIKELEDIKKELEEDQKEEDQKKQKDKKDKENKDDKDDKKNNDQKQNSEDKNNQSKQGGGSSKKVDPKRSQQIEEEIRDKQKDAAKQNEKNKDTDAWTGSTPTSGQPPKNGGKNW